MRAVAALISLSVVLGACFPGNPKAQTYAKITEGAVAVAGITILAFVNTGADCDAMGIPGMPDTSCRDKATIVGDVGLGLLLAGLIGFITTISTSEDDKPSSTATSPPPVAPASPKPAPPATSPAEPAPVPPTETPANPGL